MLHHTTPKHLFARLPILLPVVAVLALPLGSCNALSGAAIGGVIGAGLGQAAGGDTEATIAGAVIGAGIGAAIGYNVEKKREARLLASRKATEEELEAAQRQSAAVTAGSRQKAVARAEAYAEEHADEHRAAAVDGEPMDVTPMASETPSEIPSEPVVEERGQAVVPSREVPADTVVEEAEEMVEEPIIEEYEPVAPEPEKTFQAASIPDDTMIGIVPLPNGQGVLFTDIKTGELLGSEVHQLEDIKDVSDESVSDIQEDDEAKPFTLILSDKKSGKTRQYTAIYSA